MKDALADTIRARPDPLRRSLTWDRDTEMGGHVRFTLAPAGQVSVCDPRSRWQRATHQHSNGLLRQYFRNGTDLSGYDQRASTRSLPS